MTLGQKIREARQSKGMTQKELVGDYITRNMLSKIENDSAVPSVRTLEYLAGALGFAACMFLGAALLGRWGLQLLFGAEILPYAGYLVPVLGSTLCISLTYYFEVLLTIGRRLKTMTVIHLCAALAAAAVSYLAVPTLGIDGVLLALYVSMGGDMLAMGLATIVMYRRAACPKA